MKGRSRDKETLREQLEHLMSLPAAGEIRDIELGSSLSTSHFLFTFCIRNFSFQ
jgi:hypothetical protein